MTEAMGYKALLSIGGTLCQYTSCDITETRELLDDDMGIRGVRSRTLERACQGLIKVGGAIKLQPTPVELAAIWPFCVQNSSGFTLTDAMQDVTIIHDLITKKNTFLGRFGKVKLSGSPGKRLELELTFVGKTNTEGVTSLTGVPDITVRPYMMSDAGSGITIGGSTFAFEAFELEIDNHIEPTYMQGQVATDLEPSDREVKFRIKTKYNAAEAALQTLALAGPVLDDPVTASIAFTNGENSVSFAMGAVVAVPKSVTVPGKKPLRWDGEFRCYKVGTTLEVVTTMA